MPDIHPSAPPPTPHRRLFLLVSLIALLALLLASGIWALTRLAAPQHSGLVPTSTAAPTATPTPRVVYTADWSHGADGWVLPPSVKVTSGYLAFSGAAPANLTIPYELPITGYTITVGMTIYSPSPAARGGTITIGGQDASGDALYYGQLLCVGKVVAGCNDGQYTVGVLGGVYPYGQQVSDFAVGASEATYKVQVAGTSVEFCTGPDCESVNFVKVPTTSLTLVLQDEYLKMDIDSVTVSIL
jgi:hypothetical protein